MEKEIQEQRTSFSSTTTKKTVKVVQHSSESVESLSSVGELREGSPALAITNRKTEARHQQTRQVQESLLNDFQFQPLLNLGSRFTGKDADFEDVSTQLSTLNDQDNFEMKLDVTDYNPEDIQVKVLDDMVVITAKQEVKVSENNSRSRSFSKKFSIPQEVTPESIKCSLTKDGVLKITAPINRSVNQQMDIQTSSRTTNLTQRTQQHQTQVSKTENQERIESKVSSSDDDNATVITPKKVNSSQSPGNHELGTIITEKTFTVRLEVTKFNAEEIKVKMTKSLITVVGKHESEFASRSFYKEFTVVTGVQLHLAECTITTDGILTFTAPIQPDATALTPISANSRPTTNNVESTRVTETRAEKVMTSTQVISSSSHDTRDMEDNFLLQPTMEPDGVSPADAQDITKDISHINDGETIEMKLNVSEYKREEVEVRISRTTVTIRLKDEKQPNKSFVKKFTIPEGVKPEAITSNISPDGVLTISAPVNKSQPTKTPSIPESVAPQTPHAQTQTQNITQKLHQAEHEFQEEQNTQKQVSQQEQTPNPDEVRNKQNHTEITGKERPVHQATSPPIKSAPNTPGEHNQNELVPIEELQKPEPKILQPEGQGEPTPNEVYQTNDGKTLKIRVNVSDYKREELVVRVSQRIVVIEGKHESTFSSRSFCKKIPLPKEAEPHTVTSGLAPNGVLVINAPLQPTQPAEPDFTGTFPKAQQEVTQEKYTATEAVNQRTQEQQVVQEKKTTTTRQEDTHQSEPGEDFIIIPRTTTPDAVQPTTPDDDSGDMPKEISNTTNEHKFEVTLDVSKYKREEIQVKVSKTTVRIEGKQVTKFSSRSFLKETSIPDGVEPQNITTTFSPDGHLTIAAPRNSSPPNASQPKRNDQQTTTQDHETRQTQIQTTQKQVTTKVHQSKDESEKEEFVVIDVKEASPEKQKIPVSNDEVNKVTQVNDGKTFKITINVLEYRREEIEIRVRKTVIRVEGKQNRVSSNKSFFKEIPIPEGVDPNALTSTISPEGVLTIEAPSQPIMERQQQHNTQQQNTTHLKHNTQHNTTHEQQNTQQQNTTNRQQNAQQQNTTNQQHNTTHQQQNTTHQQHNTQQRNTTQEECDIQQRNTTEREIVEQQQTVRRQTDQTTSCVKSHLQDSRSGDILMKSVLDLNAPKETIDGAVREIDPNETTFKMVYDVSGYQADDISITITKYVATVTGKQVSEFSSRSFFKKFSIPHGVDPSQIKGTLSATGVLTFIAPINHNR